MPTILLIDDSQADVALMTHALSGLGVIRVAKTLDAARTAITTTAFDVVVIDLLLPDVAGIETVREVRKLYQGPAVAVSITVTPELVEPIHVMGMQLIQKANGVWLAALTATVRDLLHSSSPQERSTSTQTSTTIRTQTTGEATPLTSWRELPAWVRAGSVWGPLGIVFLGVVIGASVLFMDVRSGLKTWMASQAKALDSISDAVAKQADISAEADKRAIGFAADVRLEHRTMQDAIKSNGNLIDRTVSIMEKAQELMKDAPAAREEQIRLLQKIADKELQP